MGEIFATIERALGTALAFFYDVIPSFGGAIILLTVSINILVFPLTLKQTRSTRAFQKIQPEIKRIQAEYKDDKEKMQQELMRVQRDAGATPGGCLLPLLVQFPIWLALFRLLRNVSDIVNGLDVEALIPVDSSLYQAVTEGQTNFLGMNLGQVMSEGILQGLPAAIPFVLMLVLMVATQYFQQWHAQRGQLSSPTANQQQRQQQQTQQVITRVMPLFIGFISWNFPAGLVLYWTTSNLFRLGQQFLIFAIDGRPEPPSGAGADDGPKPASDDDAPKQAKPHPVSEKKRRRRRK
jgi:YidC/Oxa1 family membrane protein insertase